MKGGELHRVHKVNLSSEGVSVAANGRQSLLLHIIR